jgi:hypothetical protein
MVFAFVGVGGVPAANTLGRPNTKNNPNMVSDSALSLTNRRMTSSKWDSQPLVGAAVDFNEPPCSGLPIDPASNPRGSRWAVRSPAGRPIPSAAPAGDKARGSPSEAGGCSPLLGRFPMTHRGWD